MREHLERIPKLCIFSQNVNGNYAYTDSLLSDLYENYDLLFLQEPPWWYIRAAPSSSSRDGTDVISGPLNPNWGCLVRPSGLDSPPRIMVYFSNRIANLRPGLCRDLVNHRDILLFSLGLGEDTLFYANVYSDSQHTAISWLFDHVVELPGLQLMCGDFNMRHRSSDPGGPETSVHADRLLTVAGGCGLSLGLLTVAGPTHFSPQQGFGDTIIDLMFVRVEDSLVLCYDIMAGVQGQSDHVPLTVVLPGPESYVPATCWVISADSDEEEAYLAGVLSGLEPLLQWRGDSTAEVDEVVEAISDVFAMAWSAHAKERRLSKNSKGWWTAACSRDVATFRASRADEDWKQYRHTMRAAKRKFFDDRIHEVASSDQRPWDLTSWVKERNLPSHEAISYQGAPCMGLDDLWTVLDGSYNATSGRQVDLSFLDPLPPEPVRAWVPFSLLEFREALSVCAKRSAPGPDHVTWLYLKRWCRAPRVSELFICVAEACV
jgi:Endonuclease-reverse transcriptase